MEIETQKLIYDLAEALNQLAKAKADLFAHETCLAQTKAAVFAATDKIKIRQAKVDALVSTLKSRLGVSSCYHPVTSSPASSPGQTAPSPSSPGPSLSDGSKPLPLP